MTWHGKVFQLQDFLINFVSFLVKITRWRRHLWEGKKAVHLTRKLEPSIQQQRRRERVVFSRTFYGSDFARICDFRVRFFVSITSYAFQPLRTMFWRSSEQTDKIYSMEYFAWNQFVNLIVQISRVSVAEKHWNIFIENLNPGIDKNLPNFRGSFISILGNLG